MPTPTAADLEARKDVADLLANLRDDPKYKGKRLRPIETTIGLVVVQNPSRGQWNSSGAAMFDDNKATAFKAMSGLFRMCVVYPDEQTLAAKLEDYVGALDEPDAMREFRRHIGHAREEEAK